MRGALLLLTTLMPFSGALSGTVETEVIAVSGDVIDGLVVTDLRQVSVNDRGEIAVGGNTTANDGVLWSGYPGLLRKVAREDDPGPGGAIFTAMSAPAVVPPVINDRGDVMFHASQSANGVYTVIRDLISRVARHGDPVAAFPGVTLDLNSVSAPFFSGKGRTQFRCLLDGSVTSGNDVALFAGPEGMGGLLAREGSAVAGLDGLDFASGINGIFSFASASSAGQIALAATLVGPGVADGVDDGAILVSDAGGLSVAVQGGDAAIGPGLPPDARFLPMDNNSRVRINDAGDLLFTAGLAGTGIAGTLTSGNHISLWKRSGSGLEMVARRGDPAPGLPDGIHLMLWTSLMPDINAYALASTGDAAFSSDLDGTGVTTSNDTALFVKIASATHLVLREGQQAPDLPAGVLFNNVIQSNGWRHCLNGRGRLAILADLIGSGVTNANDAAIYFWTEADGLRLVAREGGPFEAPAGVFRTLTQIAFNATHGDDFGGPRNFNPRGELFFTGDLDGSAAILRAKLVEAGNYELLTSSFQNGGAQTSRSATVRADTFTSDTGGVATAADRVGKYNLAGQLYDPMELLVDSSPDPVPETTTTQLTVKVRMDDHTTGPLTASAASWRTKAGPLVSIDSAGLATAGIVYQDELAAGLVGYAGVLSEFLVSVTDTDPDNYKEYQGDGIDDDWQVRYFGLPPNGNAAPGSDPDRGGGDNGFEFLAGTDPTDAGSFFRVETFVPGPSEFGLRLRPVRPGVLYRIFRRERFNPGNPWSEISTYTTLSEMAAGEVVDEDPPADSGFYKVTLERDE